MYCICPAKTECDVCLDNEVNWIVLKITPDLVERLEKANQAVNLVDAAFERPLSMRFYDYSPEFLRSVDEMEEPELFETLDDLDSEDKYLIVENLPFNENILTEQASRVECCQLRVDGAKSMKGEVMWEGYVKHTDVRFYTRWIKIEDLKAALAEKTSETVNR